MRFVIVEDQRELCNVLAKRISRLHDDYEIAGKAYNGQDGLNLIRVARPDAAFIDVRMPFLNGLEMIEQLTKDEKQQTKCIILSAYSDFPYTQHAIRGGAFDYLLKPISNSMLEEVLERVAIDLGEREGKNADGDMPAELPSLRQFAGKQISQMICDRQITDELVLNVLNIIENEFMLPVTLKSLADRLHVNESHLCRVFSKKAGVNLIQYLNAFRIHLAKTLIDDTNLKIGDIAKMTGFGNQTYFGRLFRKHTSLSASEYKQKSVKSGESSI